MIKLKKHNVIRIVDSSETAEKLIKDGFKVISDSMVNSSDDNSSIDDALDVDVDDDAEPEAKKKAKK
jgi:hypothetical protein